MLLIATLLICMVIPVMAAKVVVTWEWVMADPDVQYFRYQMGSDTAENWTVVPSTETSYSASNLDGSQSYSLYLQQSYDGENWSASAVATSQPLPEAPAEPVVEAAAEPAPVEEVAPVEEPVAAPVVEAPAETPAVAEPATLAEPAPVVETPAPEAKPEEVAPVATSEVVETAVVEDVVPVKENKKVASTDANKFRFTATLGLNGNYYFDPTFEAEKFGFGGTLGLGFDNIFKIGAKSGIGFQLNFNGNFGFVNSLPLDKGRDYFKMSSYTKYLGADLLLTYDFKTGRNTFIVGAGGSFFVSTSPITSKTFSLGDKDYAYDWGLVASLQYRFNVTQHFALGLSGRYQYAFKSNSHNTLGGQLGFIFNF